MKHQIPTRMGTSLLLASSVAKISPHLSSHVASTTSVLLVLSNALPRLQNVLLVELQQVEYSTERIKSSKR